MFGQFSKMVKIGMLQKGKTVSLSRSDVLDFTISLLDVKKKLSEEKYKEVYNQYIEITKDNNKIEMNLDTYTAIIDEISNKFIAIAPDELNYMKNK